MPTDENPEQWVVTIGVTEIFLVNANDAKDAEDAARANKGVLIQRKTSSNSQPKPDTAGLVPVVQPGEGKGATHADLQAAQARLAAQAKPQPSG